MARTIESRQQSTSQQQAKSRVVPLPANPPPIWEVLAAQAAAAPADEAAKLPCDLAQHLDHYLYGVPRQS